MTLVINRIEEEREGNFENLGHFDRIGFHPQRRRDHADDGCNLVVGDGDVRLKPPQYFHRLADEADFLAAFAQGGGHDIGIVRLDTPARKRNLSGMRFKGGGALGEQNRKAFGMFDQRHKNRRWNRVPRRRARGRSHADGCIALRRQRRHGGVGGKAGGGC